MDFGIVRLKIKILSWLLHHANRYPFYGQKKDHFYKIKNELLKKGKVIGYDIQFIEGKKCWSCNGTGIYVGYHYSGDQFHDQCWHCWGGWYKRPEWNTLDIIQYGGYTFHQPRLRSYKKPDLIGITFIDGYINHSSTKYGAFASTVLFMMYEKGYLKRWYRELIGWRMMWWLPRNWFRNLIYLIKYRGNAYPIQQLKKKFYNKKEEKFNEPVYVDDLLDDPPF